jgi:N6-adenosine-specific RNA methylase IME4
MTENRPTKPIAGTSDSTSSRAAKYRTIVADPPWPLGDFPRWGNQTGVTRMPYASMTLDAIRELPVSDWAHAGAHLYLWTISEHLEQTWSVARAWGFEPSAPLVWCKPRFGMGLGGKFVNTTEFVLFCRDFGGVGRITAYLADAAERNGVTRKDVDRAMGTSDMAGWWLSRLPHRSKCPLPDQYARLKAIVGAGDEMDGEVLGWNEHKGDEPRIDTRWFQWPRREHSAKPEAFLDMVETVSPGPRLEMFARRQRHATQNRSRSIARDIR